MRAAHVIAGIRAIDGGPAYSVPRLCDALGAIGAEITLFSVAQDETRDLRRASYRDRTMAWDYRGIPLFNGLRASAGLSAALRQEAPKADIVHNHGLWLMPNVYAGREARRAGRALVVSPRGMLSPAALSFSRWKKRAFWSLLQQPAIRNAVCFHATSEQEYSEIRAFGLSAPVAVIGNGIDIPQGLKPACDKKEFTALSLGRIHPKKGLDRLVQAWSQVEATHPDWCLRIAGPAEGRHDVELKLLVERLGLKRVSIEPPVYGEEKFALLRDTDLFVLPTLNENFALTAAEALAMSIPVISTKGAPWSGLTTQRCGWWIEHGAEPLAATLALALAMPREQLQAMGERGRAWVERDFSWERVASEMLAVYSWLAGGKPAPTTVRLA